MVAFNFFSRQTYIKCILRDNSAAGCRTAQGRTETTIYNLKTAGLLEVGEQELHSTPPDMECQCPALRWVLLLRFLFLLSVKKLFMSFDIWQRLLKEIYLFIIVFYLTIFQALHGLHYLLFTSSSSSLILYCLQICPTFLIFIFQVVFFFIYCILD